MQSGESCKNVLCQCPPGALCSAHAPINRTEQPDRVHIFKLLGNSQATDATLLVLFHIPHDKKLQDASANNSKDPFTQQFCAYRDTLAVHMSCPMPSGSCRAEQLAWRGTVTTTKYGKWSTVETNEGLEELLVNQTMASYWLICSIHFLEY